MLELLHKALFALVSGFSELIFASTSAHQLLYRTVTGYDLNDSMLFFGIHLGCLIALVMHSQKRIKYLRSEKRLARPAKRRRGRQPDVAALMDIRVLNTAVVPLLLGLILYRKAEKWIDTAWLVAIMLILNGAVLFLPRLLWNGDKNGRSFSGVDCLLMGLGGVLGMFPGFTRIGCMYSIGVARGADKSYALELSTLLSIPAMVAMLCFDAYGCMISGTELGILQLLGAVIGAIASFAGAHMGINLLRFICSRSDTVGFAYYSWGFAIFMLLIYLFGS